MKICKPLIIASLLAVVLVPATTNAAAPLPNIVVFLVDDMGVMDTSVPFLTDDEGNPKRYPLNDFYRTPSMERLAKRGIRFNQLYAMSVCSPTRNSIMTGQKRRPASSHQLDQSAQRQSRPTRSARLELERAQKGRCDSPWFTARNRIQNNSRWQSALWADWK